MCRALWVKNVGECEHSCYTYTGDTQGSLIQNPSIIRRSIYLICGDRVPYMFHNHNMQIYHYLKYMSYDVVWTIILQELLFGMNCCLIWTVVYCELMFYVNYLFYVNCLLYVNYLFYGNCKSCESLFCASRNIMWIVIVCLLLTLLMCLFIVCLSIHWALISSHSLFKTL